MQQLPQPCDQPGSPTEHLQSLVLSVAELTQSHCSHPCLQSGSSVAIHLPLFGINAEPPELENQLGCILFPVPRNSMDSGGG